MIVPGVGLPDLLVGEQRANYFNKAFSSNPIFAIGLL
jgi:hypothetical protein